jgi:hypothetical protein
MAVLVLVGDVIMSRIAPKYLKIYSVENSNGCARHTQEQQSAFDETENLLFNPF